MGYGALHPITWLSAMGTRGGAAVTGDDGMVFTGALMNPRLGKMVLFGSEDPRLFNRRFTYMVRVANVKMPRILAFARHMETAIIRVQKPRSATLNGKPNTSHYNMYLGIWRRTRLAMPKTLCAQDSSSLMPGSGATKGVLD